MVHALLDLADLRVEDFCQPINFWTSNNSVWLGQLLLLQCSDVCLKNTPPTSQMSSLYFCIFLTQLNHHKFGSRLLPVVKNSLVELVHWAIRERTSRCGFEPRGEISFFPSAGLSLSFKQIAIILQRLISYYNFHLSCFQFCFNSLLISAFFFPQVRVRGSRASATKWWFPQSLYFQQAGGGKLLNNLFTHVHRKLSILFLIYRLWLRYILVYFGILCYTSLMSLAKGRDPGVKLSKGWRNIQKKDRAGGEKRWIIKIMLERK